MSAAAASDDDWDVVSPETAAVLRPDEPAAAAVAVPADSEANADAAEECQPTPHPAVDAPTEEADKVEDSSDRMSFVMVGATVTHMDEGHNGPLAAAATPPASADDTPVAAVPVEPEVEAEVPQAEKPKDTPTQHSQAPAEPATSPEEAARRMAESPALPGVSPVAPSIAAPFTEPPAAVLTPPTAPLSAPASRGSTTAAAADVRCLRNMGTLSTDEFAHRGVVGREAEVEHRRILNDLRLERQRLGDVSGRPSAAGDEEIARRVAAEECRAASEAVARRRAEEEKRSAELLLQERRLAELARARAGPKRCDCLGASAGHHRPSCPQRDAQADEED